MKLPTWVLCIMTSVPDLRGAKSDRPWEAFRLTEATSNAGRVSGWPNAMLSVNHRTPVSLALKTVLSSWAFINLLDAAKSSDVQA
jgi:hypothetical protein